MSTPQHVSMNQHHFCQLAASDGSARQIRWEESSSTRDTQDHRQRDATQRSKHQGRTGAVHCRNAHFQRHGHIVNSRRSCSIEAECQDISDKGNCTSSCAKALCRARRARPHWFHASLHPIASCKPPLPTGILNFASAKNPGLIPACLIPALSLTLCIHFLRRRIHQRGTCAGGVNCSCILALRIPDYPGNQG